MLLNGKVVIVTGASRGIGRAIALLFAAEGAKVAVNYAEDKVAAEAVVRQINGDAFACKARVEAPGEIEELIEKTLMKWGKIDILVNNAGIIKDKFLMMMSQQEWQSVIDVNLTGVFNCCKAIARPMIAQKSGKIINISSIASCRGALGQVNYAASKAGVEGMTRALIKEFSRYNIYVNTIAPGFIESERVKNLRDEMKKDYLRLIPLARFGRPEEVAGVALFLASDAASYIQGQTIIVDGGMVV
ncbi:beta-ketoacyl-ACP reductase [candidate division WOR-1 bacterium RIFCSPHIGHO2_01_FULL_53_15]|uniref:Beta-ketoacyl-ACP reductase n=1 Tax=candidate division WOR-1 bacterium RIFCSPHIGHO2_01_FULL_53_15 TaxID=1802564 RepID=A0A1F4Q4J8_UNCSA|nr:MAG: beta-ketoacyl-ACP reductase [candidate division WOR-1 bacterium RIFCSPHIGHO2_01_FULL_53_15]OGC10564.1 MAG: beta-ketoacyl-ACP reductase [candidate division WOR-1 bacterium RIFCSPHIGHO2_02_FULL_53_26]